MKFHTHERLITTLIGERLYASVDAAIRELLQNAEDACTEARLALDGADYVPEIVVRYSPAQGWFEVEDNGIGMSLEVLEKSFAAVGASRVDLPHTHSEQRQIAYFGIGILSCFGVSERIQLKTWRRSHPPLGFDIPGPAAEFVPIEANLARPGTCVRLQTKPASGMTPDRVPAAVGKYVRHAAHIIVENADTGVRARAEEQWNAVERSPHHMVSDAAVLSGFVGLSPGWDFINQPLDSQLTISNGGFLVVNQETELMPAGTFGYIGEIDVRPGSLAIHMNRESFVHDGSWKELGVRLGRHFITLVRRKLQEWEADLDDRVPGEHICRALVLLGRDPAHQLLDEDTRVLVSRLLPKAIAVRAFLSAREDSISRWISSVPEGRSIIFVREGDENKQVQESVSLGTRAVSFTDSISTVRIRAQHLALKGHVVLFARTRNYRATFGRNVQKIGIQDADLIQRAANAAGITVRDLSSIPDEEVGFSESTYDRLIGRLLDAEGRMKLVSLPGAESVIRDFGGRLINLASRDIQEILQVLPDAIGNPVRRELLAAYLDLRNYQYYSAEQRIRKLLVDPALGEKLTYATGEYTRQYISALLDEYSQSQSGKSE